MARITVEDCVDKFPSRFELVLVAAQRARNLYSGEESYIERENDKNTVVALREIAEEAISVQQIQQDLVEEYQNFNILDEEENENLEIEASENNFEDLNNKKNEKEDKIIEKEDKIIEDKSTQIENEIKRLSIAEEKELKENYKISEDLESVEEDLSEALAEEENKFSKI